MNVWFKLAFSLDVYESQIEHMAHSFKLFDRASNCLFVNGFKLYYNNIFVEKSLEAERNLSYCSRECGNVKTANMAEALRFILTSKHLLSSAFIKTIHGKVMESLHHNPGIFRTKDAKPSQSNFKYLRFELIEESVFCLCESTLGLIKSADNAWDYVNVSVQFPT